MACRVGITTNPERRRQEWKQQYPTLRGWNILSRHRTKSKAQERERIEAKKRGCEYHPGGAGDEVDTWYVYYFRYGASRNR